MRILNGKTCYLNLDDSFVRDFPPSRDVDDYYRKLLSHHGQVIKEESRTRIVLLRSANKRKHGRSSPYVLKVYRYMHVYRLRTWWRIPKAKREYWNLRRFMTLGIPAVQPVGFSVEKGRTGMIRSCFLITRLVEDAVDLSTWVYRNKTRKDRSDKVINTVVRILGHYLHQLHEMCFFIQNPKARNILVSGVDTRDPEVRFLDLVLARFLDVGPLARWGQKKDFGSLFGFLLRNSSEKIVDTFLETYLPDPLGRSRELVRRDIMRAVQRNNNKTPITWTSYAMKRAVKKLIRTVSRKGSKQKL
ncbi:MAG: hypothetical protein KAQ71_10890 [Desulfobulbaceae bacterium]|nr:hypothetical protein [Desulfobulbaceae bacterium]